MGHSNVSVRGFVTIFSEETIDDHMFKSNLPLATRQAPPGTPADPPCQFRQFIAPKKIHFNPEYLNPQ
jgi:hypothetical protein